MNRLDCGCVGCDAWRCALARRGDVIVCLCACHRLVTSIPRELELDRSSGPRMEFEELLDHVGDLADLANSERFVDLSFHLHAARVFMLRNRSIFATRRGVNYPRP